MRVGWLVCSLSCALSLGCETRDRKDLGQGGGPPPAVATAVLEVPDMTANTGRALASADPIIELPVAKRRAAIVSLPLGATTRKPVLVAAHGRDDYPQPLCEMFRGIVEGRAFVLCPTGVPSSVLEGAFTYDSPDALHAEIYDALAALRARFPEHVDDGPVVYAGFSLGSFQGVRVVSKDPDKTPRVILIEGGHDPWEDGLIETFADGGGLRVLFVSGQDVHDQRSQRIARALTEAGIGAKTVHAEGAGHVYTGPVREQIAAAFDWVVEGDERWKR